ncbi:hypothetical protein [Endozoicomonas sp. OPT23]|uniref:hypothetical protein n=1 Tax=Endozoicomonas sp. OPT23 TaxID=2072845 RepID=UPI001891473D|nr:hypothetical protein [Endozoicomonas sp. OPT23]
MGDDLQNLIQHFADQPSVKPLIKDWQFLFSPSQSLDERLATEFVRQVFLPGNERSGNF